MFVGWYKLNTLNCKTLSQTFTVITVPRSLPFEALLFDFFRYDYSISYLGLTCQQLFSV